MWSRQYRQSRHNIINIIIRIIHKIQSFAGDTVIFYYIFKIQQLMFHESKPSFLLLDENNSISISELVYTREFIDFYRLKRNRNIRKKVYSVLLCAIVFPWNIYRIQTRVREREREPKRINLLSNESHCRSCDTHDTTRRDLA